jgi:uncharacterized membrane protein YvbJ
MYCQNCGSEIDETTSICPYCGQASNNSEIIRNKDIKIQEMEKKVAQLEQIVKERPKSSVRKNMFTQFQPWIFITPIVFVIVFFVFFILLISLR